MRKIAAFIFFLFLNQFLPSQPLLAQTKKIDLRNLEEQIQVKNHYGRIFVVAEEGLENNILINAKPAIAEISVTQQKSGFLISVNPKDEKRIDLELRIPEQMHVKAETREGAIKFSGRFASCSAITETGTIIADVPPENVKYSFLWLGSYPRFMSDIPLEEVKEKAGGRFLISGKLESKGDKETQEETLSEKRSDRNGNHDKRKKTGKKDNSDDAKSDNANGEGLIVDEAISRNKKSKAWTVLDFKTLRGIILFNVDPSEVPPDLREKPLTEAAKAIIRSGDSLLVEAIRRVSPKYFGDYAKTLPPRKSEPNLKAKADNETNGNGLELKTAIVRVLDAQNRAVSGLTKDDFLVQESGEQVEIVSAEQVSAPINLVLLIDVSGSVENYGDFLRRAALAFINTMDKKDSIAIIAFNEDVKVLSNFTTDRQKLEESLDELNIGGGTAYYDALAFTLVEVLRPLKGERTAIVILSDGDDNRSFLTFDSLLGSIQESGALVYPLYVPSGLIASSSQTTAEVDPVWAKYMTLSSKAQAEGAKLAEISGGVYYPIQRLTDIQKAYEDIVVQLRSAYVIRFYSNSKSKLRLRIKTKNQGLFVKLQSLN
jgi:VWFA-related protein